MTHDIKQSVHPAGRMGIDTEDQYEKQLEDAKDIRAEQDKGRDQ